MKSSKKLLVALLVLTMLLSTLSVGFAAEAKDESSAVVRAQALGVLKGDGAGNLNLDKPITRAEALTLIVRISGLEGSAELMKGMTQFADVTSAHWASGYVNLGVGQKIVNGYPDGTFKPEGQVTYAEMVKMLLYAMNYGITVEGAAWPAGVMGKADQLGLFDDVAAAPDVPALRGDVVQMIDNSLTVSHLKQTGYGDIKQYEEDDKTTFLSKLKVDELEDVIVTEISKVNDKLDADEIKLDDGKVYTLKADVSAEEIFGLKVNVWVNKDDEIFFVKVKTSEKDILVDTVKSNTTSKIELLIADKEYKLAKDAEVYVNFEAAAPAAENDLKDAYGKVVLDRGEIIFANLIDFDANGVVVKVDGKKIEYFRDSKTTRKLNLADYEEYFIYDASFKAVDLEDIDEDNVIFWYVNADDEIIILVSDGQAEGILSKAKDDEITVDGKKYKKSVLATSTVSSNGNDDVANYSASSAVTENLLDEDVVVLLDLNGRVRHIVGDVDEVSGAQYGIVTEAYRSGKYYYADVFTKDGKEVEYKFANNDDGADVESYLGGKFFAVIKFKLNVDGEIDKAFDATNDILKTVVNVSAFDDDDDYITFAGDSTKYYVTSGAILMNAEPLAGDDDAELVDWAKIKNKSASGVKAIYAVEKRDIKLVVFTEGIESAASELYYGVVKSAPWRETDGWKVELDVYEEGTLEYFLEESGDRGDFAKGGLVAFKLTTNDKIKHGEYKVNDDIAGYDFSKSVFAVDDNYIELEDGDGWLRVSADAVVYSVDKDLDTSKARPESINKTLSYSDISEEDAVEVVVNSKDDVVLVLIWNKIVD